MKKRFEEQKSIKKRSNKRIDDYICLNGKPLSEQTIYDYAPFIPSWNEREEQGEDSFLVRCIFPENHQNNDDNFSFVISKGRKQAVVVLCRAGCCDNNQILQYFLSRLTGEVKIPKALENIKSKPKDFAEVFKNLTHEEKKQYMRAFHESDAWALRKSGGRRRKRRDR